MLEGSTDLVAYLRQLETARVAAASMVEAIAIMLEAWKQRMVRHERRVEALRAMMLQLLQAARLKKLELPEATLSVKLGVPRSAIQPARNATTGYAHRYPPVGPSICAMLPGPDDANTGSPIAPQARYSAAAVNPRRLPSVNPTRSTPKLASVKGTGVNGSGTMIRAQTAITALAQMTIPACLIMLNGRSAMASIWTAFDILIPRQYL